MKSALSITQVYSCWQLESRRPGFKLTWYFGQEVPPYHVIQARLCLCAGTWPYHGPYSHHVDEARF